MPKLATIWLAICLGLAGTALAADPSVTIQRAKYSYDNGEYTQAIIELREALEGTWNKAPLTFNNATWIMEPPEGFGMYKPRESNVFDAVEPVLIYLEPVGYTIKKAGPFYSFRLFADFAVLDDKNKVLGSQQNFAQYQVRSRSLQTEYPIFFTFNFRDLPAGRYKLQITVHDENSEKEATLSKVFEKR
ncbi:MAG: hypothetical protein JRG97_02040 [Deltaproteobacteria bacterium]|nr:hypothetical protein [Deltaproteobacteria bacterium]MBW2051196.1 hypothetical protein [Deltaproteobacteria bacterium]MBW2139837.1 hypothetical protein [Deltaproteobacteria bacterium]MBW2322002.1 hypothetical protein [Deltaproteobacteria bacterium]